MPTIQIEDVPDDVHAILLRRAAATGKPLEEYLLDLLVEVVVTPTIDEVLGRAGRRTDEGGVGG